MFTALRLAAWTGALAWSGLLLARGRFWSADADRLRSDRVTDAPAVQAVVPARDEADVIERSVGALLAQRYPGTLRVLVVDDGSTDDTAARARALGADVLAGSARPDGWAGKVWAMAQGVAAVRARGETPAYWWFTDADVEHAPGTLERLVATARADRRDLVSLMVELDVASDWDRLLIPAFVFFFAKLYPFAWVADDARDTAGAAGGCVLLADAALQRAGGIEAIAGALIDDCALATAVKRSGGRLRLELSTTSRSIRPYGTLDASWSMVARSAYTQLGYSPLALAGTVAGMTLLYVAPPLATIAGLAARRRDVVAAGALGWALMTVAYAPTVRRYRLPLAWALTLPLAAVLYTTMTVDSARRHARGVGGLWKGRPARAAGGRREGPV